MPRPAGLSRWIVLVGAHASTRCVNEAFFLVQLNLGFGLVVRG